MISTTQSTMNTALPSTTRPASGPCPQGRRARKAGQRGAAPDQRPDQPGKQAAEQVEDADHEGGCPRDAAGR